MRLNTILVSILELHPPSGLLCVAPEISNLKSIWPKKYSETFLWVTNCQVIEEENFENFSNSEVIIKRAFFSKKPENFNYYTLTFNEVSGLIDPDSLKAFWQNISATSVDEIDTIDIDSFYRDFKENNVEKPPMNWAFMDGLGCGDIFLGGKYLLSDLDVIICRVLLEPLENISPKLTSSSKDEIVSILTQSGFLHIHTEVSRHASFGHALFVRNWKAGQKITSVNYHQTKAKVKILQKEITALKVEVQLNSKQQELSLTEIESLTEKHKEVVEENYTLLEHKKSLTEINNRLKQEVHTLTQEKNQSLKVAASIVDVNEKLDNLSKDVGGVASVTGGLGDRLSLLDGHLDNLSKDVGGVASVTGGLGDRLSLLDGHLGGVKSQITGVNNQLDEFYGQFTKVPHFLTELRNISLNAGENIRDLRNLQLSRGISAKDGNDYDYEYYILKADRFYKAKKYMQAYEYYNLSSQLKPRDAWSIQGQAESLARVNAGTDPFFIDLNVEQKIVEIGKWDVCVRLYRQALSFDSEISTKFNGRFKAEPQSTKFDDFVEEPVFIVGCGHSGTSIALKLLGLHPALMPIHKESAIFLKNDIEIEKKMRFWDSECAKTDGDRWIEKTPPHIFQISRLLQIRPRARFILMLRDGRDVVHSLRNRVGYANIMDRLNRWIYDNVAGMCFWDHPQVKVFKYEDLVLKPKNTMKSMCKFLDIDTKIDLINLHISEKNVGNDKFEKPKKINNNEDHNKLRSWQVNQPIFNGNGKWKHGMTNEEKIAFKASKAQKLLEVFKYTDGSDW